VFKAMLPFGVCNRVGLCEEESGMANGRGMMRMQSALHKLYYPALLKVLTFEQSPSGSAALITLIHIATA
jgi:hypothetical protein